MDGFITYLSRVISGATPINFTVGFSRNQLPPQFEQRFPDGYVGKRNDGGPVYMVSARTLEELIRMYWWDKADYDANTVKLGGASAAIAAAIDGETSKNACSLAEHACHKVMKWGFGEGRRPYKANMDWAKRQGTMLASVLREGRESLTGENPNIEAFGQSVVGGAPRMNAGWTKYYALALAGHVIYDGRVGAALGFLVRRYLESLADSKRPECVPDCLGFLWGDGDGGRKLRDPSAGRYKFAKLYGGPYGSKAWARVNVQANWVLSSALDAARADWCSGPDGLRKLEAALFMLGYDLSRADEHNPMAKAA
ncbi:hypothetical protein [Paraburkholderia sediminicola]|uniref:hypothetical protein n=1 Tax=Paraburkholderia sediminicola TaxID=458836 RepID=UPI0038BA5145